jgi:hypothetical protein
LKANNNKTTAQNKWMKGFRFGIIYQIKHGLEGKMQVYGLVGQTSEGICPQMHFGP